MKLSSRLSLFNEPETLKMAKLGRELRAKGIDVIDLSLGEPDFDTPDHIKAAGKQAIDENYSHYSPVPGYPDLRAAVCTKLKRDNNLDYKPEEIITSTGAKQSLFNAVFALVDKGDEVVIPTPYWVTYSEIVKMAEGVVKLVRTSFENRYKITPAQLEEALTDKTKLFMFSSPSNPTGSVYSKEEIYALAEVFRKYPQVYIISDEIYEYINYGIGHTSIAEIPDLKHRVILINGLSKGYAMTGYRLGYMAADAEIVKACEKIQGQVTSGTCSITQRAAITALTADLKPTMDMVKAFEKRKNKIIALMSEIKGLKLMEPDGAFYVFPVVKSLFGKSANGTVIHNSDDLCMYLLNTAHVSTVSGAAFGEPDCIRLSYATGEDKIVEAVARIKKAIEALQ